MSAPRRALPPTGAVSLPSARRATAPRRARALGWACAAVVVLVACSGGGVPAAIPASAAATSPVATDAPPAQPVLPLAGRTVVLDPGHNGGNGAARGEVTRQVPDGRGGTKACNTTGTSTDAGYAEHAFAWGPEGHVIVAMVAEDRLSSSVREPRRVTTTVIAR